MVNINKKNAAITGLAALVLLTKILDRYSPLPIDYRPAEDARQTVTSGMNEAAYLAQTPEAYSPRTSIEGRVDYVRACNDPMYACIDMTSPDGEALTLMIPSALKPYPETGRDIGTKRALETSFPGQYLVEGQPGWEYVE